MLKALFAALAGMKTYLVAGATVAYAASQWWSGAMDDNTAVAMALGGAGLGALRHGLAGQVIGLAAQLAPLVLEQLKKQAPKAAILLMIGLGTVSCAGGGTTLRALDAEAKAAIDLGCQYEPAVTGIVAASGDATAITTQSFAKEFCRLRPAINPASAKWLAETQNSAAAQAGVPLKLPSP